MIRYRDACGKCGARRVDRQLGLEGSPDAYVAAMVGVFREVRRVLRDDGTLWLNVGDGYASGEVGRHDAVEACHGRDIRDKVPLADSHKHYGRSRQRAAVKTGLKPKDALGIPWRLAFALQADGWWLRSEIIWAKKNCMPESVNDRPTKAHEQIFLLAKQQRYYYDAEAIREPVSRSSDFGRDRPFVPMPSGSGDGVNDRRIHSRLGNGSVGDPAGRNRRSVWSVASTPFNGAHFAVMPPALVEPCILAGSSAAGCCPACGAPWRRVVRRMPDDRVPYRTIGTGEKSAGAGRDEGSTAAGIRKVLREDGRGGDLARARVAILGWEPSCPCAAGPPVPCTILDPFAGAGTTLVVAHALGRRSVGVELSGAYAAMARRRLDRPHAPPVRATNGHAEELPLFAGPGPGEE